MKRSSIAQLFVLASLLAGTGARAEGFVNFYGGYNFTDTANAGVSVPGVYLQGPIVCNPQDPTSCLIDSKQNTIASSTGTRTTFDDSVSMGVRGGYWFGQWFGLALDASYFSTDLDSKNFTRGAEVKAIPLAALFMFRVPLLKDDEFPLGRVHPYLGGGPALLLTDFKGTVDLSVLPIPMDVPPYGTVDKLESSNLDPALETIAGIDFGILPFLGVFVEYRYTFANPVYKDNVGGITNQFSVPLRSHHFLGGIGFRF